MPRYDYECDSCGHQFELRQGFDAERWTDCPRCAGTSRRKFHVVPIIYKGSGFYTTDYAHKNFSAVAKKEEQDSKPEKESSKASKNGSDGDKTESKAGESKGKASESKGKTEATKEA